MNIILSRKLKYCAVCEKTVFKTWSFLKAETKWVYTEIMFDIKKIYMYEPPPPAEMDI